MGAPKQWLCDDTGCSLLQLQCRRMAPHFSELLLLCGSRPPAIAIEGTRAVCDPEAFAGQGPLPGLLGGLRQCRTPWLALLPVDCPNFPPEAFLEAPDRASGQPAIGFLLQGTRQWLPGLYHVDLLSSLEDFLASGSRAMGRYVERVEHVFLPWTHQTISAERAFTNLNTPEQAAAEGFRIPTSAS